MRMRAGAERMCMAAPTVDQFLEAVKETVLANERWVCGIILSAVEHVTLLFNLQLKQISSSIFSKNIAVMFQIPPAGKGSLYIRPLLMGSGSVLGIAPAPEFTFLIYVSPVGNYFKVC